MDDSSIRLAQIVHGADGSASRFINEWLGDSDCIVARTSGSTGVPKQIFLKKSDMRFSALATCRYFGIDATARMVLPLSADYIAGKMMIVRAAVSGAELWMERPSNRPLSRDYGQIDLLPVVPSQLLGLVENPLFRQVKNLIVGGGALSPVMERQLIDCGVNVYATYGMTETCSHVALRCISRKEQCYEALPDITFDVDERGCLVVVAPEFSFGRLITNDIVDVKDEHHFIWLGRYDNVINTGGIKVFPEVVEQALAPFVEKPFYIIGRKSLVWGEEVVMYVEGDDVDCDDVMKKARLVLDRYSMPKEVIAVKQFQRTGSGKIKRSLL